MRSLLDVNVLVALVDRQHVAHVAAHRWLAENLTEGWASCPITENGCVRVLTNPRYPAPVGAVQVLEKLRKAMAGGHHEFWPDDISITASELFQSGSVQGHQQITDFYLLSLAVAHGGRLVTFDRGIQHSAVAGATVAHLVVLQG